MKDLRKVTNAILRGNWRTAYKPLRRQFLRLTHQTIMTPAQNHMKTPDQIKPTYGPVYAAAMYPDLAAIFQRHGYALARHE